MEKLYGLAKSHNRIGTGIGIGTSHSPSHSTQPTPPDSHQKLPSSFTITQTSPVASELKNNLPAASNANPTGLTQVVLAQAGVLGFEKIALSALWLLVATDGMPIELKLTTETL